jgi:phage-related minor tail protein
VSNDLIVGIKLTADGKAMVGEVKLAREEIDKLGTTTQRASGYSQQLNAIMRNQNEAFAQTSKMLRESNAATAEASSAVTKLGSSSEASFSQAAAGAEKSAFATAQARRELIVLGHEAMTGNFSRMPGSFMVLAERIGLSGGALTGIMLPIAAVGGAAYLLFKAFSDGHKEMEAMNNALAVTSNYAGMTRGEMRGLAESMTYSGEVTIGVSKDIVTALVASGRIGSQSIAAVARLAADFARDTGQDVAKITPELIKLFADPAKGAEELNKSMHFLTTTDLEHIATLERLGQVQEAQLFLSQKLSEHMPKEAENVGILREAYRNWAAEISSVIDKLDGLGRKKTTEEKIKQNADYITTLETTPNANQAALANAKAVQMVLMDVYKEEQKTKTATTEHTAELEKQGKAWDVIKEKSKLYHVSALEQELALVNLRKSEQGKDYATQEAAKQDAILRITKEISDARRALGAESRQANQAEIEGALKLREIAISMGMESNDAQLKLGQITQAEHDKTKLALELQKNAVEQITNIQLQAVPALTAAEKQKLAITLYRLKAEQAAIEQKGGNEALINEKKYYDEMRKSVDAAGAAEIAALDKAIAAQQLHNAEIGKTAAQKELEKAAIENVTISRLEDEAAALRAAANEVDMAQAFKDAYNARANELDIIIAKRKELAGLQVAGAEKDKIQADVEEWKKASKEINKTLTDALMRGFESGKGFAQNLRDTIVNMFKTTVLRPIISAVMAPVSGAIASGMSSLGFSGAANAAGAVNGASSLSGIGSLFTNFGGSVDSGLTSAAVKLYDAGFQGAGTWLGANAGAIGQIANVGGQALGYANALFAARDGQWGKALGSAAGTYFGGPIGGAIGSTIGSWVDSAFGGGGGAKVGADVTAKMVNGNLSNSQTWSNSGGDALNVSALAGQAFAKLNIIAESLGGKANSSLMLGYDLDPKGTAPGRISYGVNGNRINETVSGQDTAAAATALQAAAARAVLLGLQSADLPAYLSNALKVANASTATSAEIDATIGFATALKQVHDQLNETRTPLEIARSNIASLGTSVESYTADFKRAMEAGMTPALLDKWKALGTTVAAVAAEEKNLADAVNAQRRSMDISLMELTGNAAGALSARRADEIAVLDASLRPLQNQINAQNDLNTAAEKAIRLGDQRRSMDISLMELTGNAAGALLARRADEIAALDASLRPLQNQINAQNDLNTAAEKATAALANLSTTGFSNVIDFKRTGALLRNPRDESPVVYTPSGLKINQNQVEAKGADMSALLAEIAAMRVELKAAQVAQISAAKATENVIVKWENDGMPSVRVVRT